MRLESTAICQGNWQKLGKWPMPDLCLVRTLIKVVLLQNSTISILHQYICLENYQEDNVTDPVTNYTLQGFF